jgi:hypothetical protein
MKAHVGHEDSIMQTMADIEVAKCARDLGVLG